MMEFLKLHITFYLELIKLDFSEKFPKKKENFEISSNISLSRPGCGRGSRRYVQWTQFRRRYVQLDRKICYSSSDHRLSLVLSQGLQFRRYRRFKICFLNNYKLFSKTTNVLGQLMGKGRLGCVGHKKWRLLFRLFITILPLLFTTPSCSRTKNRIYIKNK